MQQSVVPRRAVGRNTVPVGRTTAPPPQYPENAQTHFTIEPSLGLFRWWELGGYFQMALRGDQSFDYAGIKLRNKFVTPPKWSNRWRLGLNIEFSLLPETYDRGRWANELRPIVAWESEAFAFAFNPIVDTSLAGPDASAGPSFEPCFSAAYKIRQIVSVGIEYYSNLGPLSGFVAWREQEQYLFEVFNLLSVARFELNAGVGEGLNDGSNRLVFKAILGYAWEKDAPAVRALPPALHPLPAPLARRSVVTPEAMAVRVPAIHGLPPAPTVTVSEVPGATAATAKVQGTSTASADRNRGHRGHSGRDRPAPARREDDLSHRGARDLDVGDGRARAPAAR